MTPTILYYIILAILVVSFLIDKILEYLNSSRLSDSLPEELRDIYDPIEYKKSQNYNRANYNFGRISSTFSLLVTLIFFQFDGFEYVDSLSRGLASSSILIGLLFFGIIMVGSQLLSMPFSYYQTFVIEEQFGFNRSTKQTFFLDMIKGWILSAVLGGFILSLIIWFYEYTQEDFWIYGWVLVSAFTVGLNMFYSSLIVPLFNKQTPLEDCELKEHISNYAKKTGFDLESIFVIDGSKRSSKANAYFSGFGRKKRITLFDTLINDLDDEETVGVLAHEVGHYSKKHILFNLSTSILVTGLTFYILSLFISNPLLSHALGVSIQSFHVGLIAFSLLYSPFGEITGLFTNYISRSFEYQADNFAAETYNSEALVRALTKLNKNSLSNLTPHPAYVFVHYSHPTLLERVRNLKLKRL